MKINLPYPPLGLPGFATLGLFEKSICNPLILVVGKKTNNEWWGSE